MDANDRNYILQINFLRGIAIIGVMFAHLSGYFDFKIALFGIDFFTAPFLVAGKHGVTLFFLISSYTLCRSLHNRRTEAHAKSKYLIRRFFRIAPAYYLVIAVVYLFLRTPIPGYSGSPSLSPTDLLSHLTFVNGFFPEQINSFIGVEWSTATEFIFYFLLPFLFTALGLIGRTYLKLIFSVVFYLIMTWLYYLLFVYGGYNFLISRFEFLQSEIAPVWMNFFIASHLHTFALGIVGWVWIDQAGLPAKLTKFIRKHQAAAILILLAVYFSAGIYESTHINKIRDIFCSLVFWTIYSFLLLVILSCCELKPNRLLNSFGDLSFSLYLVHFPIFFYGSKLLPAGLFPGANLVYPLVLILCSFFSSKLIYLYLEQPGIRLGRKVIAKCFQT